MPKKQTQKNKKVAKKIVENKNIEKLLREQTSIILNAVDKRLQTSDLKTDKRLQMSDLKTDRRLREMNGRLQEMETKADQRFDRIITNLDRIMKSTTDTDDEIKFIKLDINRIKRVVKEKLAVDLT